MKNIIRKTHVIDAEGQAVGRLATKVATILRGKHKPEYQAHIDMGDCVQIINIKGLKFSGKKLAQKKYHSYSGYLGGLKTKKMSDVLIKNPEKILIHAVREMLPPTKLRVGMIKRLIIK